MKYLPFGSLTVNTQVDIQVDGIQAGAYNRSCVQGKRWA